MEEKNFYLGFFDFDGTILTDEDSHKDIFKLDFKKYNILYKDLISLKKDNIDYILCTGRTYEEAQFIVKKINFFNKKFFISLNGSFCLLNNKKYSFINKFNEIYIKLLLNKILLYTKKYFTIIFKKNQNFFLYKDKLEYYFILELFNLLKYNISFLEVFDCLSGYDLIITCNSINKYISINKVVNYFKKSRNYIKYFFIGDSDNDKVALKKIDVSFTFDTSPEYIIKSAKYIVKRFGFINNIIEICRNIKIYFINK